jgi:hypothetical protein
MDSTKRNKVGEFEGNTEGGGGRLTGASKLAGWKVQQRISKIHNQWLNV